MNFCPACGKNETWCPHLGNTPAPRAATPEDDGQTHWDIAEVGTVCHDECAVAQLRQKRAAPPEPDAGDLPKRIDDLLGAVPARRRSGVQNWIDDAVAIITELTVSPTPPPTVEIAALIYRLAPIARDGRRGGSKLCRDALAAINSLAADLAESRREVERTSNLLWAIQFAANGYCPSCAGWNAGEANPNRGCAPGVHTKTCPLAAAIDAAKDAAPPETGSAPPTGEGK